MSDDGECNKLVLSFQGATGVLASFLEQHLPGFGTDWWTSHVYSRLTYLQQRFVLERNLASLNQLDFAALLRVLDQNWYELTTSLNLPREGRTWVKELQTVRNKWAHLSAGATPPSEVFRDADTLARLLSVLSPLQKYHQWGGVTLSKVDWHLEYGRCERCEY
jgi:ATP-dependent helicase HepA